MEVLRRIMQFLDLQTVLVGVVIMLLVLWLRDMRHGLNMPPGPLQWPILGSLPSLALFGSKDPLAYLKTLGDKYGGIFSVKLGDHFAIFISDYNIMKEALMKQGSCFSHRPSMAMERAVQCNKPGRLRHGLLGKHNEILFKHCHVFVLS
jgi:hypothetical protein